jgi:hypothetical protein
MTAKFNITICDIMLHVLQRLLLISFPVKHKGENCGIKGDAWLVVLTQPMRWVSEGKCNMQLSRLLY